MSRIAEADVSIQTFPQSVPSPPSWFGEVVLVVTYLRKQGVLTKLCEHVRFISNLRLFCCVSGSICGLHVDHTTISRWTQRYAPELEKRCRPHLKP